MGGGEVPPRYLDAAERTPDLDPELYQVRRRGGRGINRCAWVLISTSA